MTNTFETIENLLIGGQVNIDNVYNQIMENIRKILNLFLIEGEGEQIEEKISSEVRRVLKEISQQPRQPEEIKRMLSQILRVLQNYVPLSSEEKQFLNKWGGTQQTT